MTPLARRIARDAQLPPGQRAFCADSGAAPDLAGVACFDVSEVYDLAYQLACDVGRIAEGPTTSSPPAARTWIEWSTCDGRFAMLVETSGSQSLVRVTEFIDDPGQGVFGVWSSFHLRLSGEAAGPIREEGDERKPGWYLDGFSPENLIPAFLMLISAPAVTGDGFIAPHRGSGADLH